MKNFLNVFKEPKKEQKTQKTKFEETFEKKFEKQLNKVSITEPDKQDLPIVLPKHHKQEDENQPVVKLLNPFNRNNNLPVAEQARTREQMIQEGAFRKLLQDEFLQKKFEERLDEAERLQKTQKFGMYDKDYEVLDKSKMQNKVVFEAVDHLFRTKELL